MVLPAGVLPFVYVKEARALFPTTSLSDFMPGEVIEVPITQASVGGQIVDIAQGEYIELPEGVTELRFLTPHYDENDVPVDIIITETGVVHHK